MIIFNNFIDRPLSVITQKRTKFLFEIDNFPLFCGCVDTPLEEDLFGSMRWEIDPESGVIQLSQLVPLEILYSEQHLDGVGQTWARYYKEFAAYITKQYPTKVLEIGGGQGVLAQMTLANDKNMHWTIMEPNPRIDSQPRLSLIRKFFDSKTDIDGDTDAVVMSQVFEHIYNPQEMVMQLSEKLSNGAKIIIAYPQIKNWLKCNFTNALNFEHTMLIDDFVPLIFQRAGFRLEDEKIYESHSIFYTFVKCEKTPKKILLPNFYAEYEKIFEGFVSYHKKLVEDLNRKISLAEEPVFLFGAHIFSTYLFAFGLNNNISGILDNGSLKKGRRFYGTNFIVEGPQILKGKGKVNVILKAGLFNDEIKSDILDNINGDVVFW